MDHEVYVWLQSLEERVQSITTALTPKKETEQEEQAEPPLGKSKETKTQERQKKVKKQMDQMKYKDAPDEPAIDLGENEEIVTDDGEVIEEEDGIEVLNE